MSEMLDIIVFFGVVLGMAFNMFRAVEFGDTGISLLMVYIALLTLDIIVWFIIQLISVPLYEAAESEREEAYGYDPLRGGSAEMGIEPVWEDRSIQGEEILR